MTRIKLMIGGFCACMCMSTSAFAVVISNPLTYTTPGLVGTAKEDSENVDNSPEARLAIAQQILALAEDETLVTGTAPDTITYIANTAIDYSGTITGPGVAGGAPLGTVPAGYDYVLAKYDGHNAGYVLFYLGGAASTIPTSPYNLWTDGSPEYGISGWTGYGGTTTRVPEPGTLTLLGVGFLAFGMLRRQRARA